MSIIYIQRMVRKIIAEWSGFEWDAGNLDKNWVKHHVSKHECEQVFFSSPLLTNQDMEHPQTEPRYYALGISDGARKLFIAFTLRQNQIRIISARDMSKKEREAYEKIKENPKI